MTTNEQKELSQLLHQMFTRKPTLYSLQDYIFLNEVIQSYSVNLNFVPNKSDDQDQ